MSPRSGLRAFVAATLVANLNVYNNSDPTGEEYSPTSILVATGLSATVGAAAGYFSVKVIGGTAKDQIAGAIAVGSIGAALGFAYTTGKGPEALLSGFLGGSISYVLTELIHDPNKPVTELSAYLSFIRGFASSAVTTATRIDTLNDTPFRRAELSFVVTTGSDLIEYIRKDYDHNDFTELPQQAAFSFVDAIIAGLFAFAKYQVKFDTTSGLTPDKAATFFKENRWFEGVDNDRFYSIVLDTLTKELQAPIKGLEKLIAPVFDPTLD